MVIDNLVIFREGLIRLLEDQEEMQVVGEANSILEVMDTYSDLQPDIIVTGVGPSEEETMEAIKTIASHNNKTAVIILTSQESDELMFTAFRCGVRGYLHKNAPLTHLIASMRAIARGEAALPRHLLAKLLEEFAQTRKHNTLNHAKLEALTSRELEILSYLSSGKTNREIANAMFISENTVRVHVHNILYKLKMQNRREAGEFARRIGFT